MSSGTPVLAPVAGRVVALEDVPDPVFAQAMVGPGLAIDPGTAPVEVVTPVAGRILKLHPHAFVVLTDDGVGVLVHLGIDTVRLEGRGFELLAGEGDTVEVGDPVVRWDPGTVEEGMSTLVPVVAMDRAADALSALAGGAVSAGDPLFTVT